MLIPGLLFLLYQIIFRRRKRRRAQSGSDHAAAANWPGLDSEFYRIERKLKQLGFERPPDEPVARWLERVTRSGSVAGLGETLETVLKLHYQLRFDPRGLSGEARRTLRQQVEVCLVDLDNTRSGASGVG